MSTFVQLLGLAAIVVAAFTLSTTAGLILLGAALILCGFALDGVSFTATAASLWARRPLRRDRKATT